MHLYLDRLTKLGYLLAVITMSFGPSLITRIVDRRNIVPRSTTSLLLRTWQTRIFPRRCSRPRLCLHFDMFSMKIGFAAFDQPGQLNRPFNYPIRYTYIYTCQPRKSSPRRANDRPKLIGVARDVSFAIQLRQDDGRSVRSHGDAFRIDPVLLEDEHPSIGSMEWNNTPFVTNHPVLHDIHRVELDSFPCSSLKSNRCSFHLDLYNVFTRSTTNSSLILSARSI